jgi:ribosome biogenesis GTPase / thiamine phosphate phosphatase
MKREQKKLMRHFEEKAEFGKSKQRKAASRIRNAMKKKGKRQRFDSRRWEDDHENVASYEKKQKGPSLEDLVAATETSVGEAERADYREGLVISMTRRYGIVLEGDQERECFLPARLAAAQHSGIAVGDRVLFFAKPDGSLMIHSVEPRRTFLARPDPHNVLKQRVIAANIDHVVNVVSVKSPPLRPRLIDRYLIAITAGGAEPVVCVNKVDLLSGEELELELSELDVYRGLGLKVVRCSAGTGEGLDELHRTIAGGVSVFVGHSGVGKSSILKALVERLEIGHIDSDAIRTAGVSKARGTGRHTTRMSTLFDLGHGTRIIDTPGIRELGLWNMDEETLRGYFPEFEELAAACRFNDCTHTHEPDCAVKAAVDDDELPPARFETYLRLVDEMKSGGSE